MAFVLVPASRRTALLLTEAQPRLQHLSQAVKRRNFFNLLGKVKEKVAPKSDPTPIISQDNLFHPFSRSPFPAVRARGEAIQKIAPCPVCAADNSALHGSPKAVRFECPDCGWPTHCSEQHWAMDTEHKRYCSRLREANEDDHDLRSGRRVWEFEFPGTSPHMQRLHILTGTLPAHRSTALRGSHFFCQLGRVLVYKAISLDGHGTLSQTC